MDNKRRPGSEDQRFLEWLDEDFEPRVAIKCANGQWFALLMDFDITGCGSARAGAVRDAFGLLGCYLADHFQDGASFSDALRPIPQRLRMRIYTESALARPLRHVASHTSLARETTYSLPPGLLPAFTH